LNNHYCLGGHLDNWHTIADLNVDVCHHFMYMQAEAEARFSQHLVILQKELKGALDSNVQLKVHIVLKRPDVCV
jgi:hypothetical protein